MDLQYFLNILWRRIWLILSVMIVAAATTYFFVDRKADTYKATGVITTSIVGQQGIDMRKESPWIMEFYVKMGFENLIESIQSRRNINFLTFRLLLHDLYPDSLNNDPPFRRLQDMKDVDLDYSPEEIESMLNSLNTKLAMLEYSFDDPEEEMVFQDLAKALKYDHESILKYNLKVDRSGDTDNLKFEFESENPRLCVFAVNTFSKDFLRIHRNIKETEGLVSVDFYRGEVNSKKAKLTELNDRLNTFRSNRNLYDAGKEAQGIIGRKNDLRGDLEVEKSRIPALRRNIIQLDKLIEQSQNKVNGTKQAEINNNTAILNMKKLLEEYNTRWTNSEYKDKEAKRLYDLTKKNLDERIIKEADILSDKDKTPNSKRTESDLFEKKVQAQLEFADAQERIKTIESDLAELELKQTSLVSDDAVIKNLESEIQIAQKDYELMQARFQKESLNFKDTYEPIKILEHARIPEKPESKMKMVLSAFAGIVGAILSTVMIFLMAFFDTSINSANKFRKFAGVNLMGTLNKVKTQELDLKSLFSSNGQNKELDTFKESLRNLRYAIENSDGNKFLFTSTKKQEGKTFLIVTLAHAMSIKSKKILIIDTNFKNNTLTQMSKKTLQDNLLNTQLIGENNLDSEFISKSINSQFNLDNVDIIGNKGTYQSPSEVFAGKDFKKFVDGLTEHYDYIFFEGAPLNNYSDTKELVHYVDKVIAVFAAESDIKESDKNSITYLRNLGHKFLGGILNKMDLKELK